MRTARDPRASARGLLTRGPMLLPATAAIGALLFLAVKEAGFEYFPDDWQIVAVGLLALLVLALVTVPAAGRPPRAALAAAGLLTGYALWSYASIAWAGQEADAWDGANRATFYALVFAVFALWPLGRRGAAVLAGATGVAIAVIAVVALARIDAAADPEDIFVNARLGWPVDYPNANVALWFIGFWPCVALAARREAHPALRGVLLASAVVLATTSLLGQSRGWLFALPIVLAVYLLITPARVRAAWTLIAVGVAMVAVGPTILEVYDRVSAGQSATAEIDSAVTAILLASAVAGLAGAAVAYVDRRTSVSGTATRWTGVAMVGALVAVLAIGATLFAAREGDPVAWVDARWEEFKGGAQPKGDAGTRFTQTLGSNRYDFWRVAWDGFQERPLTGIGADNFRQPYLISRASGEEPRYPHSVVLRTLGQTGLVGAVLLFGAIACALVAALRAIRARSGPGGAAAAGAAASFVYFMVHGSADWFYEFPALGGLSFALLGVAAGLVPRPALYPRLRRAREPLARTPAALALTATAAGLVLAAILPTLLATRTTDRAVETFNEDPARAADALAMLDRAAGLNPESTIPRVLQGRIALALGRPRLAASYYADAIERDPRDLYSHLVLAALESAAGRRARAERLLVRAYALSPRDELARRLLERVRDGRRLRYAEVAESFTERRENRAR